MAAVQAISLLLGRLKESFFNSIFELSSIGLRAPVHTILSRRRDKISISFPVRQLALVQTLKGVDNHRDDRTPF